MQIGFQGFYFAPMLKLGTIKRSRGVETPPRAVGVDRDDTSSTMVGEALAYVQGSGLKASAVVSWRLSNSPAARGKPPVADLETGEWALAYTVLADETGVWRIYAHHGAEAVADERPEATVLPLPGAHTHTLAKLPSSDV